MDNNKRKFQNEDDLIILKENEEISLNKKTQYLSYTDRYFKKYYKLNVRYENNDHMILMHSNKVAVCTIAPSHPILDANRYQVTKVEFIQQVNDEMSGKHKHFAKNVNVDQPMCKVYCNDLTKLDDQNMPTERYFLICSCLNAKLIEINEKLISQPNLIQSDPFKQGFIAILIPKLANLNEQISDLITHVDYTAKFNNLTK